MLTQILPRGLRNIFFLATTLFFFSSCKKEPGDGGLATIKGKVISYRVDNDGVVIDSSYDAERRVYISYGNHTWTDDDTRTSYTGEYAFQWLQKGDYKVWVISDCSHCLLGQQQEQDIADVTIDNRKGTVEVRNLKYYHD